MRLLLLVFYVDSDVVWALLANGWGGGVYEVSFPSRDIYFREVSREIVYGRARLYGVVRDGGYDCRLSETVRQAVTQPLGFFTSYNLDICTGNVSSQSRIHHMTFPGAYGASLYAL